MSEDVILGQSLRLPEWVIKDRKEFDYVVDRCRLELARKAIEDDRGLVGPVQVRLQYVSIDLRKDLSKPFDPKAEWPFPPAGLYEIQVWVTCLARDLVKEEKR